MTQIFLFIIILGCLIGGIIYSLKKRKKMALITIHGKNVVLPNYDYIENYWPILSKLVCDEVGNEEIKNPSEVEEILKKCFSKICGILEDKLSNELRASFYIFCKNLHEDSIELWKLQIQKIPLGINEEDFAASRRILKIILEQSTKLKLKGCQNFYKEIEENKNEYASLLEELLYIGTWCFSISEYIAKSQLFPTSTGIQIIDNELNILTYQPYPELFKYIFHEIPRHNSNVVLSDSINEFKEIINDNYGVSYDELSSFVHQQLLQPVYRFGISRIDSLIKVIKAKKGCDESFVTDFYAGLTISKKNCLSIERCIYNNQDENRHIFRPILELNIDGEIYNIIGYYKWLESLTLLSTNSFPFGLCPSEWKKHKALREFIQRIDNTHDKLLENPIEDILIDKSFIYDLNLESFIQPSGVNINIKQDIGDIDILFLDVENKLIYICECKHNRSRHDMNNWKRDYSNFKDRYESQLKRKVDWATANKEIIGTHFHCKLKEEFDLTDYEIRGIFIINAPTIYMFNGNYRALTITDFIALINREYTDTKFEFTDKNTGTKTLIEHPYFDNIKSKFG